MASPQLSILVPVLNEAATLPRLLSALAAWRERGDEVVVSDGGSRDDTLAIAREGADRVVAAPSGRSRQMNAAAAAAQGRLLWFLHADSGITLALRDQLLQAWAKGARWGRFDVRLSGDRPLFRVIAMAMNRRSRWTGIATGDQGIFVDRETFEGVGGWPEQPLMEDIALSRRLRGGYTCACLPGPLVTSSRRWSEAGAWRTILLMWRMRFDYWRGVDAATLHRRYYRASARDPESACAGE